METAQTPSDEETAALRAKYPDRELRVATHGPLGLQVVIKVPSRAEWRIFRSLQSDQAKRAEASQMLVDSCVVWPDKPALTQMLDAHPALLEVWAGEIVEAAGVSGDVSQKKL